MNIYTSRSGEITIGVDVDKTETITKVNTVPNNQKKKLNAEEETAIRSRIGALQWYATLIRPDLCIELSRTLSYLNREADTETLAMVNRVIKKFEDDRFHFYTAVTEGNRDRSIW